MGRNRLIYPLLRETGQLRFSPPEPPPEEKLPWWVIACSLAMIPLSFLLWLVAIWGSTKILQAVGAL